MSNTNSKNPTSMSDPMSMSNTTSMTSSTSMSNPSSMSMMSWLHFGNSDHIFFETWHPSSHAAVAGACVGLVLFAILERGVAAFRRAQEVRWRPEPIVTSSSAQLITGKVDCCEGGGVVPAHRQLVPPFSLFQDVPRGVIQALQSTMAYALMMVVMTFNGAYIISIILGIGVGEVLFGRVARYLQQLDCC